MLTRAVNHIAHVCFSRWKSNQQKIRGYLRLRSARRADKEKDYLVVLNSIRQTFLPSSNPRQARSQDVVAVAGVSTLAREGASALQTVVQLLKPQLMHATVQPVTGIMVDLVRSMAGSTLALIDGMLGYIPYIGPAVGQLLSQVIWACSNFLVSKLEELLQRSVSSVFARIRRKAHLIASTVAREFSQAENLQHTLSDFAKHGLDSALKAGFRDENARAEGGRQVSAAVFAGLGDNSHLRAFEPIALDMMGLMRGAFPSVRKEYADCDATSLVLSDAFALATPKR